jgi:hypothetical protein
METATIQPLDALPQIAPGTATLPAELNNLDQKIQTLSTTTMSLAYSMLSLGLQVEQRYLTEIDQDVRAASDIQKQIEACINLNGKLTIPADKEELPITDEIRALSDDLKAQGLELLQPNETKINRERLSELKATLGARIDLLKTQLQKLFTTKIQVKINELHSLMECMKTVEKYSNRLFSTIIGNFRGH